MVVRETDSFIKIMQPISPNYIWENGVKQIKDHWNKIVPKLYFVLIAKDKDPSLRVKMYQTFVFIFTPIFLISADWILFI